MKFAVLGATGRTGREFAEQALAQGHTVTALVRSAVKLDHLCNDRLSVVEVDVTDPHALAVHIAGHDAVISAIGHVPNGSTTICTDSARSITHAMADAGGGRLVIVGVAAADAKGDDFFTRAVAKPIVQRLLRPVVADARRMEALVSQTSLDWTILRPPMLIDKPLTARYRTQLHANVRRGFRLSRANLAHAILRLVDDDATLRAIVGVAS